MSAAAAAPTATAAAPRLLSIALQPRWLGVGLLLVVLPWYFCRRQTGGASDGAGDFEMDETGRRRRIMHGDL